MIGEQLLYKKIVKSSIPPKEGEERGGNAFKEQWRDLLASRYYYHASHRRKRYDDCLMELSREFFITSRSVVANLKLRLGFIQRLTNDEIATAELRKRYPWYDWSL